MTDRKLFVDAAFDAAAREADEHYAALYQCFVDSIPQVLHRTGEYAPSPTRPAGFSATSRIFIFGVDFGEGHELTFARFVYKKKAKAWKQKGFKARVVRGPFVVNEITSDSLASAILVARDLHAEQQKPETPDINFLDSGPMGGPVN